MYRESKEIPSTETKHPCLTRWRSRIDWAEQFGSFHADHKQDAWRWDMCAVGEAHRVYRIAVADERLDWTPKDSELKRLGGRFADAVEHDEINICRRLIVAIEQRLAELA